MKRSSSCNSKRTRMFVWGMMTNKIEIRTATANVYHELPVMVQAR